VQKLVKAQTKVDQDLDLFNQQKLRSWSISILALD